MRRFRPVHGLLLVVLFMAMTLSAAYVLEGGYRRADYERVKPDRDGLVHIDLTDLGLREVNFYHFLNTGNQEVRFFVGRDERGQVQVAFDANEICYKAKRGYRHESEWVVCNKCDKSFRLAEVNAGGGGCKPVPLPHRVRGDELVLAESDILKGWRFFR